MCKKNYLEILAGSYSLVLFVLIFSSLIIEVFFKYNGPWFKSHNLDDYHLLSDLPGSQAAAKLASEIQKLIGQTKSYEGTHLPIKGK